MYKVSQKLWTIYSAGCGICSPLKYPYPLSLSSSLSLARGISKTSVLSHGEFEWKDPEREEDVVQITVYNKDGQPTVVRGKIGDNLLYLSKRFGVELEGACEASLACSTCHIYIESPEHWDKIPVATETEEDLLDQAPFLRDNSRLGCQITLTKDLNGIKLRLPAATKNFYVDGHKPTPH